MSIKLEWEIEAEQSRRHATAGEDAETRRRRRRARLRFLLVLVLLFTVIGGVIGALAMRLRQVDFQIEQRLRDTVAAEVAALRVGDQTTFIALQRSAADEWYQTQGAYFAQVQTLKQTQDLNLTGTVLDVAIDGLRGRVVVQEIVSNVPYARVWNYWRYEDGWRHVPPDYTFWGANQTITRGDSPINVRYRELDAALARELADALETWRAFACEQVGICAFPAFTLDIVPDPSAEIGWSPLDPNVLIVPSPYTGAARVDQLFEPSARLEIATLIADRLLATLTPEYPADAYYLRQAVASWLVERFAGAATNSHLITSLANEYGAAAVGRLINGLTPTSGIDVLTAVTSERLDVVRVDWRDFLTWRLTLENQLIEREDYAAFANLYDLENPLARANAETRFRLAEVNRATLVISVLRALDETGAPTLRAVTSEGEIVFRLVGADWKRVS